MSAESHSRPILDKLRNIPNIGKNATLYMGLVALGRVRKLDGSRGLLPEPYDFFNHNGNILSSVTTAMAASIAVRLSNAGSERFRRTKIMSAAIIGGVAVNSLVETKTGLSLPIVPEMFRDSTPDPIDFGYGMTGALIGGGMILASEPRGRDEIGTGQDESSVDESKILSNTLPRDNQSGTMELR